jgi:hypothetical protein
MVRSITSGAEHGMEPVGVLQGSCSATRTSHGRPTASVAAARAVVQVVPRAAPQRSHRLAVIPQRTLREAARSRPPGCAHSSGRREADRFQPAARPGYCGDLRRDRRQIGSPWSRLRRPWQRLRRPWERAEPGLVHDDVEGARRRRGRSRARTRHPKPRPQQQRERSSFC